MIYHEKISALTEANECFRKVLHTGPESQLVVMSIAPQGDVGEEVHAHTEQTLFFLSGTGKALIENEESSIEPGDVYVITAGTKHNFINTGAVPLKLYTVYAPAHHIDGRIHATKADADADIKDEAFGEQPQHKSS